MPAREADPGTSRTILLVCSSHFNWIGLRSALDSWDEVRVVDANCKHDACAVAKTAQPSLILIDASWLSTLTVSLIEELQSCCPASKIIAIGELHDPITFEELLRLGVGYLGWTDLHPNALYSVVTAMFQPGVFLCSTESIQRFLVSQEPGELFGAAGRPVLTAHERQVLNGLVSGLSQRELAGTLYVSKATIERTISDLRRKFHVPTTCALCALVGYVRAVKVSRPFN